MNDVASLKVLRCIFSLLGSSMLFSERVPWETARQFCSESVNFRFHTYEWFELSESLETTWTEAGAASDGQKVDADRVPGADACVPISRLNSLGNH